VQIVVGSSFLRTDLGAVDRYGLDETEVVVWLTRVDDDNDGLGEE
jgi:hypothetical protein